MRDRLIKGLYNHFAELAKDGDWNFNEMLVSVADYLLADGWMRPPCKIGQTIYRNIANKPVAFKVMKIEILGDKMLFIDDAGKWFCVSDIGTIVFLTKEDAKEALKEDA